MFKLPNDWIVYTESIKERCENLISHGLWQGIELTRLKRWMSNFKSDEEKYFCSCILDGLIYRSEDQTISLLNHLLQRTIVDITSESIVPTFRPIASWYRESMNGFSGVDPGFRFVPVVKSKDAPTKSGYHVARLMRRKLSMESIMIINSSEIRNSRNLGAEVYIFIDDFLGTGEQFCEFVEQENLEDLLENICLIYIPLVAHESGISKIQERFNKKIIVTGVEILGKQHMVFQPESGCFKDGTNTAQDAKEFYHDLLEKRSLITDASHLDGYGNLELLFAFNHAVPDNSLSILYQKAEDWSPLFDR